MGNFVRDVFKIVFLDLKKFFCDCNYFKESKCI